MNDDIDFFTSKILIKVIESIVDNPSIFNEICFIFALFYKLFSTVDNNPFINSAHGSPQKNSC